MKEVVNRLYQFILIFYRLLEALALALVPKRFRFKQVSGETVLITGGGSGIGRLLALRFARLGCRVVVWDVNRKGNEETQKMVQDEKGECFSYVCDVTKKESVYEIAKKIRNEVGIVTILVNNAGIVSGKTLMECPDHLIEKTFEVNTLSHFWTCKAFLPAMREMNHGHVVCVASAAGLNGIAILADYCSSKAANFAFQESLRQELLWDGYNGIYSTIIAPYFINTGMFNGVDTGILPFMDASYVADEIIKAVLINQEILILPKLIYILYFFKSFLPVKVADAILNFFGFSNSMQSFKGRKKQE